MATTLIGPSTLLLRCSLRPSALSCSSAVASCSTAGSLSTSSRRDSKSSKKSGKREERKGPSITPRGTNAKPAPSGRPKRYDTTYGIPPLNPALFKRGSERLDRERVEHAQQPDYQRMWTLQDELAGEENESKIATKLKELAELRANQPKRHPLWAFFHEKDKRETDDAEKYMTFKKDSEGKDLAPPGYFALAHSLERPNKESGRSGRSWDAVELRRKSFDDLHQLWYSLVIERNILYTQQDEARRSGVDIANYTHNQEQIFKCRKSMARIKYVLNERRRAAMEAQQLIEESRAEQGEVEAVLERPAASFTEPASSAPIGEQQAAPL